MKKLCYSCEYWFTIKKTALCEGAGSNMKKIKLGFLTVLGNEDNHSQMMSGVFEAAEKYNAIVIRFAVRSFSDDYRKVNIELNNIYKVIEAQKLDGLMFLGWMPGVVGPFFNEFLKRFSYMPVVSVGALHRNVPSVFADSKDRLIELFEHLILVHGCKSIVYIPPVYPDKRTDIYNEVMRRHGIYRDDLIISYDDLRNTPFLDRMKRVTAILFDERKVKADAICVPFDTDAQGLYASLKSRGISIPGDIAVVSNEDSEFARYSLPPLTVVTFPWREVGYHGCQKIISGIGHIPDESATGIPGKLIIRNSCGCRSNSVKLSKIDDRIKIVPSSCEANYRYILQFSKQIHQVFPYTQLDIEVLLSALVQDFEEGTKIRFFKEFEDQLQEIVIKYPYRSNIDEIEDFLCFLRNLVISQIALDSESSFLFCDIMLKAMVIISEKTIAVIGSENVEMKVIDRELHYLGQGLSSTFSLQKLVSVLENSLHRIQIPSCYIFLSTRKSFDQFSLILEYSGGVRAANTDRPVSLGYISDEIVGRHPKLLCQLLHIDDEYLGFVVFEPYLLDVRIYETLALHISSGLKSAILLEKLSQEIALREEKEKQLTHNANYDSLTDLYNRRYFIKTINFLLGQALVDPAANLHFYLVFIDFDDFKKVNDKFGHDVGDQLIIAISMKFRNLIRRYSYQIPEDLKGDSDNGMGEAIFRIGGDEFTAIIAGITREEMKELAAELVDTVNSPYMIAGHEICISCSIGISTYPDQSNDADALIKYADTAMYLAKMTKNMYYFSEETAN